jgi:Xaa-Pro aminopeptidase
MSFLALNAHKAVAIVPGGADTSEPMPSDDPVEVVQYAAIAMADLSRYIDEYAERDKALLQGLSRLGLQDKALGIDGHHFWYELGHLLNLTDRMLTDVGQFLVNQRIIKDAWEQEQLAFAVRLNDVGFAAAQRFLRAGVTDIEAFSAARRAMAAELGGDVFDLHGEFSGGPEISGRGGRYPFGYVMQEGDLLIADIYPVVRGYKADTTRNFVVGQPATWQLELHAILEDAMAKGEEAMRPGLPASELDRIVRGHVEAHAPEGARMFHHSGHGIGIGVGAGAHWPPFIVPHSKDVLQEGMTLTLEPGLYIAGKGGMRLEDNYVVTSDGCKPLGTFPKKLAVCAD